MPVRCFDHTLQLAINDAVQQCKELQDTVQKAKSITTHFKHSGPDTKKLKDRQKQLGMKPVRVLEFG